jgi:hypothetical protein
MGEGGCGTNGKKEKCLYGFGGKTLIKETTQKI